MSACPVTADLNRHLSGIEHEDALVAEAERWVSHLKPEELAELKIRFVAENEDLFLDWLSDVSEEAVQADIQRSIDESRQSGADARDDREYDA